MPVVVCSRKNKDKSEFLSGRSVGRLLLSSGNWTVYGEGIYKWMPAEEKGKCWRPWLRCCYLYKKIRGRAGGFSCVGGTLAIQLSSPPFFFFLFFPRCGGPSITEQPDTIEFGRQRCAMEIESPIAAGPVHPWMIGNTQVPSVSSPPLSRHVSLSRPLQMSVCVVAKLYNMCSKPPSGSFDFFVWSRSSSFSLVSPFFFYMPRSCCCCCSSSGPCCTRVVLKSIDFGQRGRAKKGKEEQLGVCVSAETDWIFDSLH